MQLLHLFYKGSPKVGPLSANTLVSISDFKKGGEERRFQDVTSIKEEHQIKRD